MENIVKTKLKISIPTGMKVLLGISTALLVASVGLSLAVVTTPQTNPQARVVIQGASSSTFSSWGNLISVDYAANDGRYFVLYGPTITEQAGTPSRIGIGTFNLVLPPGFTFDTSSNVRLVSTPTTGSVCDTVNNTGLQLANSQYIQVSTPTATSIAFNLTKASQGTCYSTLTFSGVRLKPLARTPLITRNMAYEGTVRIPWVNGVANLGTLKMVETPLPATSCVDLDDPSTFGTAITKTNNQFLINANVKLCNKTYTSTGTMMVINKNLVTLDCDTATLVGPGTVGTFGVFNNGFGNATIKNCEIKQFAIGIRSLGVNTRIDNNNIHENGEGMSFTDATHGRITNNDVYNNRQIIGTASLYGIVIVGNGTGTILSGNTSTNNNLGLKISATNAIAQDNIFNSNLIGVIASNNNVTLNRNTVSSNLRQGIIVDGGARITGTSNIADSNADAGIKIQGNQGSATSVSFTGSHACGNGRNGEYGLTTDIQDDTRSAIFSGTTCDTSAPTGPICERTCSGTTTTATTTSIGVTGNHLLTLNYSGSDYPHNISLTQDSSGHLTGSGESRGYTWVIDSGLVSGNLISFSAHYTAAADAVSPLTVFRVVGTIATNGAMSGMWFDNYRGGYRLGTWLTPAVSNSLPVISFSASSTSIASGANSTLTWLSINATTCTGVGGTFAGSRPTSGTLVINPTSTTTYTLTCTGTGGSSPVASVTVTVAPIPTATLSASPTSIASGANSTLTWSSTNATACTGVGGTFAGSRPTSGTLVVRPTSTTTYTLTCTGTGGVSSPTTTTITYNSGGNQNPALPGYYADPNAVILNNTFYIYPTTDGTDGQEYWGATSFKAFSSNNLVDWIDRGVILNLANVSWCHENAWAPTIVKMGSIYYFYFSACHQIGVATSTSPTGPFVDALNRPLVAPYRYGSQSIDPHIFVDDDGQVYFYFGSSLLNAVRLNADMTSFNGTPVNITPYGAGAEYGEGTVVFKRNNTYYFMWSVGNTGDENYHVNYGTSSSPLGPITYRGIILSKNLSLGIKGPGGNSVIKTSNGNYYMVYHRFGIPGGNGGHRETCIDRLEFNSDGTIKPVTVTLEGITSPVTP